MEVLFLNSKIHSNSKFYFIKPTSFQSFDGTAQSCLGSEGIKTFANIGRYSSWSEWIQIICLLFTNKIFDHSDRYLNLIGYFYFCSVFKRNLFYLRSLYLFIEMFFNIIIFFAVFLHIASLLKNYLVCFDKDLGFYLIFQSLNVI